VGAWEGADQPLVPGNQQDSGRPAPACMARQQVGVGGRKVGVSLLQLVWVSPCCRRCGWLLAADGMMAQDRVRCTRWRFVGVSCASSSTSLSFGRRCAVRAGLRRCTACSQSRKQAAAAHRLQSAQAHRAARVRHAPHSSPCQPGQPTRATNQGNPHTPGCTAAQATCPCRQDNAPPATTPFSPPTCCCTWVQTQCMRNAHACRVAAAEARLTEASARACFAPRGSRNNRSKQGLTSAEPHQPQSGQAG
jgi:hypothetical protein